jgi:hypothetical protein
MSISKKGSSVPSITSQEGRSRNSYVEVCPLTEQVVEVEAFCSVHDMIHAAIEHYPPPATLRQVLHTDAPTAFFLCSW